VKHGRRKVTLVHKANILKFAQGLFLDVGRMVARDFAAQVDFEERIVDAMAMNLVLHPERFDVIVTTNLFGDILSDQISGLVGGLGLAPGANIGRHGAIFEAVHGTASDIAGKNIANPGALMLAACMLLEHLGDIERARRVRTALEQTVREGRTVTRDRVFLQHAKRFSEVIVVPGNHDVAWWKAPLGFGNPMAMLENYRRYISEDVEPVLRIAGATIVGLNTSQGVTRRTLTWNLRDISIIGDLRRDQLERARTEFERSRAGDARAIVMHHHPVMGELARRHGLKHSQRILGAFAEMGVDLVLCGHDHQEAVHYIEHTKKGTVISTAGTISNAASGGRPRR